MPYDPSRIDALRTPSSAAPWRVLVSGCLAAWPCGVDGDDYGLGEVLREFFALRTVTVVPFCPEQYALGTPRAMPDLHGGDGVDLLAGRCRAFDQFGNDLTEAMKLGARAMVSRALEERVELAILTDMSAACGSQVISDGCRLVAERRFQKGLGVATAALIEAGVDVVSQRDHRTLATLRKRAEPTFLVDRALRDHHEHPWTLVHLPTAHPRR